MTNPTVGGLWLAIATLTATAARLLAWASGMNSPTAILTAGGSPAANPQ
ncbi:hypothetical protein AB0C06_32535 [Micromonospora inaquosa]